MTRGELLNLIKNCAVDYIDNAIESIDRNRHMNKYNGEPISQNTVDALIVDFINYIGYTQCLDYGLYTSDLRREKREEND